MKYQSNRAFIELVKSTDALLHNEKFDDKKWNMEQDIKDIESALQGHYYDLHTLKFYKIKERKRIQKYIHECKTELTIKQTQYDTLYGNEDIKAAYKDIEELLKK